MKKSRFVFLPFFLFAILCMAVATATPARTDIHFVNGWYQSHDKRQCYWFEVIDEKTIRHGFYQLNNGNIKSIGYYDERPYYIRDGFVCLPEHKRKYSTVGDQAESLKIPLGQSGNQPLKIIMNPSELAKYYSKEKGYRLDLKYSFTRISAPPNAATAAIPNGKKDEKKSEPKKPSSGDAKTSNNTKSSGDAKEESGGLGTAAIAGIVVVGAAAVGGLLWFAKGASKGTASVAATQNRPANFTNTPPAPAQPPHPQPTYPMPPAPPQTPPEAKKPTDNQPRFCTNCGAPLVSGAKFCENCGSKV